MAGLIDLKGLNLDSNGVFMLGMTILAFLIPIVLILPPVPLQKSDALLQTHSLAGLGAAKSNLKKQHAAAAHAARDGQPASVQSLVIYPVKSCKGIELGRSKVLPHGLQHDRIFTFAQLRSPFPAPVADSSNDSKGENEECWEFITQRQFARLANVVVELWLPDEMKLRRQGLNTTTQREVWMILRFPWRERGWRGWLEAMAAKVAGGLRAEPQREVLLPVDFPSEEEIEERGYTYENVRIWKERVRALNMEKDLSEELRLFLGVSNRLGLFRLDPAALREVHACAPSKDSAGYQPVTGFQDAYPVNIQNLNSVQSFSTEIPKDAGLKKLDILRFRPNIVVSGAPAYEEETWKKICLKSGSSGLYNPVRLHIACRTTRCKLPNVDPADGTRHASEPDRTLRKVRNVDEGAPLKGCLGMQSIPLFDKGLTGDDLAVWIGVGMTLEVEETGKHVVPK
ncbi:MOSC domain-containing protein [Apiospora rasikravindrae]|uniref:MOSC domain-containing protein n=1 Tax=Apiospora rasikravindrae TaxID=990691 RepID=A0ABR1U208_9PEZI